MLVAWCISTSYLALPISLNSLDREGVRLLSPRDSQILPKPACRCRWTVQMTQRSSRRSLMKILPFVLIRFQLISSGAQLGSIGDLCSIWGSLLLFWYRSQTMSVLDECNVIHVFVWRGECKPTMYLFPFYLFTWVVVKITLLATLLSMRLCL